MSDLKSVSQKYEALMSEWSKKKGRDSDVVSRLLLELKLSLTELSFLPTDSSDVRGQELLLGRGILEVSAQHSLDLRDIPGFERSMAQLKTYYFDYPELIPGGESALMYELLGLNLLRLLSQNHLAEFHIQLELLPLEAVLENPYITCPVSLEQDIMEGTYNKILLMKDNVPSPKMSYFIDLLLITIRNEIGICLEKAYNRISASEAAKMLYLKDKELSGFAKERGWIIRSDKFLYFQADNKTAQPEVPTLELAKMAINYAKEMEQIV
uniref:26S proteasome non-ATPase regulatory subunit 8 n=1 Tax=Caligus clemensi TaxID=344056 RepID=C1C2U2_CALCM|nr:26S proteasome non-ATPase regulatory subunit 8 [Caligus clemensi]